MYKSLNSKQRDVMITCLMLANHEPNSWEWQGEIFTCQSGQFVTSLSSLSKKCASDVKVQSVRTALLKLEKWGFLTNKSTKTGRLITICNWSTYQDNKKDANKQTNKQPTKHQQSTNKELTTNKNDKNDNNYKEGIYILDYLNEKAGKNYKKVHSFITARLKDFSVEDCKKVIDIKVADWKDTDNDKYLRPETLFRESKFEAYLNQSPKKDKYKDVTKQKPW